MESVKAEIVKEFLEKFPNTGSRSIAKIIYQNNKTVFKDKEDVRDMIRYYRGAIGKKNRKYLGDRKFLREVKKIDNPLKLPESDETEFEPVVLPKKNDRILILPDFHCPYHNIEAITSAIQYGQSKEVNTIILNGDILDAYQLSRFVKDPRKRHFKEEIEIVEEILNVLLEQFKGCEIYWKNGNHEERYETYLKIKAPELCDIEEYHLDKLLMLNEKGIHYVTDKRTIKAGMLNIVHGHEFRGSIIPPVNPARGIFLRSNSTVLVSNWHRTSEHTEPNIEKDLKGCWSTGCLCSLAPEYDPNAKWNHGAAIVTVEKGGFFHVDNFIILNGKIL